MRTASNVTRRILALVLCLGIALPLPAHSASVVRAPAAPVVSAAGAVRLNIKIPKATVAAPALSAAALQAPAVAPALAPAAHPVVSMMEQLNLPQAAITRADAAQILKAAEALPEGKLRNEMIMVAKAAELSGSSGGGSLGELYEGSQQSEDSPAVSAPSGAEKFWSAVSRVPGLKKWAGARAEASKPKQALRPVKPLTPEQVHYKPAEKDLPASTRDIPLADKQVVGQDAAVQAILFGAKMTGDNYNIFVSGPDGSGRETAVRHILSKMAPQMQTPGDLVAATNFKDDEKPVILELKPGQGEKFKAGVAQFVKMMQVILPKSLSQGQAAELKKQLHGQYEAAAKERQDALNQELSTIRLAGAFGVTLLIQQSEEGANVNLALTHEGKPMSAEQVQEKIAAGVFTQEQWQQAMTELQAQSEELAAKIQKMLSENQALHTATHQKMALVDRQVAASVAEQLGNAVLGSLSGVSEDDEAHAALQARLEQRTAEIDAAYAGERIGNWGFKIIINQTQKGIQLIVAPTYNGEPIQELPEGVSQADLQAAMRQLGARAKPFLERYKQALKQFETEHKELHANAPKPDAKVVAYVQQMTEAAAQNYQVFLGQPEQEESEGGIKQLGPKAGAEDFFRVSVLVNNGNLNGAPVIWEKNPTYENLFGMADNNARTMVIPGAGLVKAKGAGGPTLKAGSYLKARGGFLVLDVMSVLREPGAWQALMAAIRSGQAEISEGGLLGLASMKGEKYHVPGKTKVILIGAPMIRMLLAHHDQDFARNFNVTAEFEPSLAITKANVAGYLYFLKKVVAEGAGEIMDLSRDAISTVLEFSARIVDSNQKLTAQFGVLYGLLREASFWAREAGRAEVTAQDINNALITRDQRDNVYQRHMRELYHNDVFKVQTKGAKAGQINGLAVMGAFGVPMRITVVNSAGAFNIVSADQDAGTTGSSFNKSLGVIKGFMKAALGKNAPAKGSINISFEQNYGGIDGDSATTTMLYAILSSLSGVKIKQNMAVTGSADQFGTVQAIGGVNEKIEGFYDLVASKGGLNPQDPPTVLVPTSNVKDLQLRSDVVDAIRAGTFRVIAVDTVMQGIEQLTGVAYSEIMSKVQQRLAEMK